MTKTYEYSSGLAEPITAFITEKRSLGCKYEKEAKVFYEMDQFLVEQGVASSTLSKDVIEKWISKRPHEKRKNQRWRLNFTKRFVSYLLLHGYDAYYPPLTISSRDDKEFVPYIFTNEELARLISYFENMEPSRQYPNGHLVFPLLFKTLICCGLRAGEAAKLRVKDVDLANGILHIENAKHGKSRLVPISESLRAEYEEYCGKIHACTPHFLDDSDSFIEQAGALPAQAIASACHAHILARGTKGNNVHRLNFAAVYGRNVPVMFHKWQPPGSHTNRKRFNLCRPNWVYAGQYPAQRKTAGAIEQAPQGQFLTSIHPSPPPQ